MNKIFKLLISTLVISLLVIVFPAPVGANNQPNIPTEIAGCPVIFIETPENTIGMHPGTETLVILDNAPKAGESAEDLANLDSNLNILGYLKQHPLLKVIQ